MCVSSSWRSRRRRRRERKKKKAAMTVMKDRRSPDDSFTSSDPDLGSAVSLESSCVTIDIVEEKR
jgi:hypothetical protein